MRIPRTPSGRETVLDRLRQGNDLAQLTNLPTPRAYLHWDKLRYHEPPPGLSHEDWWAAIKWRRWALFQPVPLHDTHGRPFQYAVVDRVSERLHRLDVSAAGRIEAREPILNQANRDRYVISSLIEEAATSSILEGAATTRAQAKDLLRSGRAPRDTSERMIVNNFLAMERIKRLKDQPLSVEIVLEIHRRVTLDTLDRPQDAGRLRSGDEVRVYGRDNQILHTPPPAHELAARMQAMCDFANGKTPHRFVHPILRAIILHFWLAYDHPFVDGNGRTARALFYWLMLRKDYWLFEFISISRVILRGPSKYGRAFLYTETDENDLTYFIDYHLRVLDRAVRDLHDYIEHKTRQMQDMERGLGAHTGLNHRQRALLSHALRHPSQRYTFASHRNSHGVAYQTARTDLLGLAEQGYLVTEKIGRTWTFRPAANLDERLGDARATLPE